MMQTQTAENDDGAFELVEILVTPRPTGTTVRVRSLHSREVLLSIRCDGDATGFAVLSAERFCAERALPLVMRPRRAA